MYLYAVGDGGPELADLAVGLPGVHHAAIPVHVCIGADYLPVAPLRHIVQCHRVRGGQGRDTAFLTWMSGRRCQAPWSSTTWWRTNMPQIRLVPVNQGMTREELAQRLQSGWVLVGRQAANVAQGIIDPSKPMPPSGVVDVDVWGLSEPMLPAAALAHLLYQMYQSGEFDCARSGPRPGAATGTSSSATTG
jgi:hypothetical protein